MGFEARQRCLRGSSNVARNTQHAIFLQHPRCNALPGTSLPEGFSLPWALPPEESPCSGRRCGPLHPLMAKISHEVRTLLHGCLSRQLSLGNSIITDAARWGKGGQELDISLQLVFRQGLRSRVATAQEPRALGIGSLP